ncbi:MAG TPA: PD-(D/E)XK nuclease family protein [Pyrinomonadaceae bacterium]
MKQIWLGPVLGSNRSRLVERCADLVANGRSDSFVYLAASHPLLEVVTQGILDGGRNHGVWGELPVYLFRGFVRRILSTAIDERGIQFPARVPIDREELPVKRSLVSQILRRLFEENKLKAIGPVATREGCINTMTALMGELQRSARTPSEVEKIVASRIDDSSPGSKTVEKLPQQIDFDREVSLVYSAYSDLLNQHGLTEDDADQLRALSILNGSFQDPPLHVPWLADIKLLVLDGFFDFTPVQGEMLRLLIPRIPEVIVQLNHDARNPEIFLPFRETISHLHSIDTFEEQRSDELVSTSGVLGTMRERLFNPNLLISEYDSSGLLNETESIVDDPVTRQSEVKYFECGDRDTEIRTVAKEIKRLVREERYRLADIALVVRQRASYAEMISRVMTEEGIPCNLSSRIEATDVPANRAALKLLSVLEQQSVEGSATRISELADLVKSEYFRLKEANIDELWLRFLQAHSALIGEREKDLNGRRDEFKQRYRIGLWDADALENAFAYVGSELRVNDWLSRARKLVEELPAATSTKELLNIDGGEQERDPDIADQVENAETAKLEEKDVERKRRPSRDIHPVTIAWTALVVQAVAERLKAVPREGKPTELRSGLMRLFDEFSFRKQVVRPIRNAGNDRELPRMMLNFNSLEALRRAFVAAIKSIDIASSAAETVSLATFVQEVRRSLSSQSQLFGSADRGGLRVLEATDVRGLRFRAVFIAGLNEGGFPLRAARDWIYPHEERERLKRYGLTLEDISPATLLKEEHYFYQVTCRATDRVYLTRPLLLEDDSETVASYYIDELRRAIAPFRITAKTIRRDYEGNDLWTSSNRSEVTIGLVRQQERHLHHEQRLDLAPQPRIKRLLALARNDELLNDSALRRIEIERERAGQNFGPYDGQITEPELIKLLASRFGTDFVHSASGLSVYGNCAYRFFAQRVLKLEPRGEAALDLQAIDAGKLLHDILRRFFERHRRQRLTDQNRDALTAEMRDIADRVFDEHERVVPPLNKQIWKIDREIRKILLDQVLLYELEIQEAAAKHGVVPGYFEMAFGGVKSPAKDPHSTEQPLKLSRSTFVGDESIKISGQIDRVDLASDDTIIAYDYKLSTGSTKEDIEAGRSLQIPIYLEALEQLLLPNHPVAGGGYYIIRGGKERRNKGIHRADFIDYSGIRKNTRAMMSDHDWQQIRETARTKIWDFLDQMRAGDFPVNPSEKQTTCRFCDFAAVCRYERYRIEKKRRN